MAEAAFELLCKVDVVPKSPLKKYGLLHTSAFVNVLVLGLTFGSFPFLLVTAAS